MIGHLHTMDRASYGQGDVHGGHAASHPTHQAKELRFE